MSKHRDKNKFRPDQRTARALKEQGVVPGSAAPAISVPASIADEAELELTSEFEEILSADEQGVRHDNLTTLATGLVAPPPVPEQKPPAGVVELPAESHVEPPAVDKPPRPNDEPVPAESHTEPTDDEIPMLSEEFFVLSPEDPNAMYSGWGNQAHQTPADELPSALQAGLNRAALIEEPTPVAVIPPPPAAAEPPEIPPPVEPPTPDADNERNAPRLIRTYRRWWLILLGIVIIIGPIFLLYMANENPNWNVFPSWFYLISIFVCLFFVGPFSIYRGSIKMAEYEVDDEEEPEAVPPHGDTTEPQPHPIAPRQREQTTGSLQWLWIGIAAILIAVAGLYFLTSKNSAEIGIIGNDVNAVKKDVQDIKKVVLPVNPNDPERLARKKDFDELVARINDEKSKKKGKTAAEILLETENRAQNFLETLFPLKEGYSSASNAEYVPDHIQPLDKSQRRQQVADQDTADQEEVVEPDSVTAKELQKLLKSQSGQGDPDN